MACHVLIRIAARHRGRSRRVSCGKRVYSSDHKEKRGTQPSLQGITQNLILFAPKQFSPIAIGGSSPRHWSAHSPSERNQVTQHRIERGIRKLRCFRALLSLNQSNTGGWLPPDFGKVVELCVHRRIPAKSDRETFLERVNRRAQVACRRDHPSRGRWTGPKADTKLCYSRHLVFQPEAAVCE